MRPLNSAFFFPPHPTPIPRMAQDPLQLLREFISAAGALEIVPQVEVSRTYEPRSWETKCQL